MSKEFEEELSLPSCEFHFAPDGPIEGVGAQDIECDATNHGEILWREVLAGSGVVFVEDDVELPMEIILDAPMSARDFEHAVRWEALGERDIAGGRRV